jgi:hypothetical protein
VHIKKHLSFSALKSAMAQQFRQIDDLRQQAKVKLPLHDCLMSGFAMMFFQDPSLLAFQQRIQDQIHQNNLTSVFGVSTIPKDTQMREVIDTVTPEALEPIFADFISRLQRGKQLSQYQLFPGSYLISLDGSEYFSSEAIHCPHCLVTKPKKGTVRYHHQILQTVIVHPDKRQVLALAPEEIRNSDGSDKQDCEINAGKRCIHKIRTAYPKLDIIITADGLYSKQPFIDELKKARMSFILVAKPDDHKVLFEWVNDLVGLGDGQQMELTGSDGRRHRYLWVNRVPLSGSKDADDVNFIQYQIVSSDHKITYQNSWVTDIAVDANNVVTLVKGGRARWKIENETFNTLKNQGYHIEHNFGHGQQNLSFIFFMLNLLAFAVHQILDLCDRLYQAVRYRKFTSRMEYFNQLRCTFRIMLFKKWEHMLHHILDPPLIMAPG